MEKKRRNSQTARNLRLIAGALLGATFVVAEGAEAKDGGKGGGDKGGGGDIQNYTQYLHALSKFDTDHPPRYMS